MHDSYLRVWLEENNIGINKAAEVCRKKKCIKAFYTLLEHDFTLPTMAITVCKALGVPPDIAKPMGRAIDQASWESKKGLEPLDPLDYDQKWYKKIGKHELPQPYPGRVYLDVTKYRQILSNKGINYETFTDKYLPLYRLCRTLTSRHDTRVQHIKEMASILGVDVEEILTDIPTIAEQEHASHIYVKRVKDGIPLTQKPSAFGKVDFEKLWKLYQECPLDGREMTHRYATLLGHQGNAKNWKNRNVFKAAVIETKAHDMNGWEKIQRIEAVIGCKPEDFATRYTYIEYMEFRRAALRKSKEEGGKYE